MRSECPQRATHLRRDHSRALHRRPLRHHIPTLEQLSSRIESAVNRTVRPCQTALLKVGGQLHADLQLVHHYSKGWARRAGVRAAGGLTGLIEYTAPGEFLVGQKTLHVGSSPNRLNRDDLDVG